ncbi:GNAT family N-acetyltransferase [Beijerinckia mobilis]|uniref:GNAT family N-acetyltransferase n=1 Tax=Beijerinckia mobilis TaxID=231434 RepID=UPI000555121A|nr:GNAT family N-acetyltransferase [Beijerinckia mobilis]
MPVSFHLRPAEAGDFEPILALWVATWAETFPDIDFASRADWLRDHLETIAHGGGIILLAEDENRQALGVATVDPRRNLLEQIAVAPQAKGTGVAGLLLAEARRQCPGPLELDVNQDNARALRFYEKEGFVKIAAGSNPKSGRKTWSLRFAGTRD